jgi:hypothetical protein
MRRLKKRAKSARMMMQRPKPIGIGHNMGPPFEEAYYTYVWKKAQADAWKAPDRLIIERRAARAEELGMSYRAYSLEIMERGRHL